MKTISNTQHPIPSTLIAGGAGFIGSHLCDRLIAEGHSVICVDNLLTGSKENITHLLNEANFTFVQYDVTKPIELDALISEAQHPSPNTQDLDYVLHLASPASPVDYLQHPIETMRAGAEGTYHLLELARAKGAVFLLASTSEVYGDPEVNPQPEDYWGHVNPIGPRSVYDEAKRYAEAFTMAYHRKYGLSVRIARIFNTYGPRMQLEDGRALPNFICQALRGEPLTVYGDGLQTRSFCYVDDLVEGLYHLLLSEETGPINLGNPEEITIKELAEEVLELMGSQSQLTFKSLPQDDPKVRCPDTRQAENLLNWRAKVERSEGIAKTIASFREQLGQLEESDEERATTNASV